MKPHVNAIVGLMTALATVAVGETSPAGQLAFGENVGFVDPLIGTACHRVDESNYAGMVPAVGVPFGGVKWVPMTRLSEIGRVSYGDSDPNFLGFVGTRQPCPWMGDFGQFSVQARVGTVETDFARRGYAFDRARSVFTPYYCKVVDASGIVSEVAAASHAAILRFTYPKGSTGRHIVIDASRSYQGALTERRPAQGGIDFTDGLHRCVLAHNHDLMNAELDPALSNWCGHARFCLMQRYMEFGTYADGRLLPGSVSARGDACGGWITFGPEIETVVIKVGMSAVSADKTYDNQIEELGGCGGDEFSELVERGRSEWNRKLATVEIEADEDVKKIFYTALYHSLQFPTEFSEAGKYYSAFDFKVHDGVAYTSYSLWDTYRAEHPLLTIIAPERVNGMINSLLAAYREGGWLPKWPNPGYTGIMVGGPAEIVLAEAWVKGFRGFDVNLAYEAVRKNATQPQPNDLACRWSDRAKWCGYPETRAGLSCYQTLGYVAADRTSESVSRTQDFGHDDLAAAVLAEAAGHTDEAREFRLRSRNYTNLWNAAAGTFLPRNADGSWSLQPGDLESPEGERWKAVNYTEQTPQTACWGIAYDTDGMAAMMGGKAAMESRLDDYFAHHFYDKANGTMSRHENETTHHVAYLYAALGCFDKCARQVRRILTDCYSAERWGMEGNDDCGQMSAWYVFSALGFYPLDPVSGEYVIGSPLVSGATLRIGAPYSPAVFTIAVKNQSKENSLVKSVKLNGVELTSRRLRHADIVAGGLLEFEMVHDVQADGQLNSKRKEGMK